MYYECFGEGRPMFGVDGAAIALQQARTPEEPRAVPQPGEFHALLGSAAQQVDEVFAGLEFGAKAAADHQQIRERAEKRIMALRIQCIRERSH